jgi:hypothetical protein
MSVRRTNRAAINETSNAGWLGPEYAALVTLRRTVTVLAAPDC